MSVDFLRFHKNRIVCFEDYEINSSQLLQQATQDIIDNSSLLCGRGITVSVEYEPCEMSENGFTSYQTFSFVFFVEKKEIGRITYATDGEKPEVAFQNDKLVFLYIYMELSRTCTDIATLQYSSPNNLAFSMEDEVVQALEQYF